MVSNGKFYKHHNVQNDRIQIRLLVNTGSLSEKRSETGFSSLVSKLNVLENTGLTPEKRDNLWKKCIRS